MDSYNTSVNGPLSKNTMIMKKYIIPMLKYSDLELVSFSDNNIPVNISTATTSGSLYKACIDSEF